MMMLQADRKVQGQCAFFVRSCPPRPKSAVAGQFGQILRFKIVGRRAARDFFAIAQGRETRARSKLGLG